MSKNNTSQRKRGHIAATLGAELLRLGMGYEDRNALRAVLHMTLDNLLIAFGAGDLRDDVLLGEAIAHLVQNESGPLSVMGEAVLFQRQYDAHRADCDSWKAQPESLKLGPWRQAIPSRVQQMLMIRMSQSLGLELPGDVTRGQAHDWIKANGGNPRYNTEKK